MREHKPEAEHSARHVSGETSGLFTDNEFTRGRSNPGLTLGNPPPRNVIRGIPRSNYRRDYEGLMVHERSLTPHETCNFKFIKVEYQTKRHTGNGFYRAEKSVAP